MSIAEKLTTIAENEQKVYEAGKKSEYDAFWDMFQNKGYGANYRYAFCYSRFDDSTFNPKYDINCTNVDSSAQYMFYSSPITDTKVGIYAPTTNIAYCFRDSAVKTIRLLNVHESTEYSYAFTGCEDLENITIGGTIGKAVSFSPCTKLTHDSLMSIISALKDYSGSGTTVTLTLGSKNLAKLTDAEKQIATGKGWTLA